MLETSARLLKLLSLLQSRGSWTGPELAERLEVGARRSVATWSGCGSSATRYRRRRASTEATASGPAPRCPLLLDDEEAVAVAVGLRPAAGGTVAGIEETSLRALAKLEQLSGPGCAAA